MTNIKQWEYTRLVKICANHPGHLISLFNINEKDLRKSAWLRIMGLMETWDIVR